MYQYLLGCLDDNEKQSLNNSISKAMEFDALEKQAAAQQQ